MSEEKDLALAVIYNANLNHPDLPLVECFLRDAVDDKMAARYILDTCENDPEGVEFAQFVQDWKALVVAFFVENPRSSRLDGVTSKTIARRDNHRCRLTGTCHRFWNQNHLFSVIPRTALELQDPRLYDILGAFITPSLRERLFSMKDTTMDNAISNHWMLSNDAAKAFSRGEITLENLGANQYDIRYNLIGTKSLSIYSPARYLHWRCHLPDDSNTGIHGPDPMLIEIHRRFSKAIKWAHVATGIRERIYSHRPRTSWFTFISESITLNFLAIWSRFPGTIRLKTYKILRRVGSYLYGSEIMGVQRLPFGMYLKFGGAWSSRRHIGEFSALKLVRSRTSVPVPIPIDHIITKTESYMVTSRIQGQKVGVALDYVTDKEMELMVRELRGWIEELHGLKQAPDSQFSISNARGGPCLDFRVSEEVIGPFRSEREFNKTLWIGALPDLSHRDDHDIVFTHGDLNMRNILVHNGRISGIIDWENAGWYPEYWESTKCHFSVRYSQRWLRTLDKVFEGKYKEELAIERQFWMYPI